MKDEEKVESVELTSAEDFYLTLIEPKSDYWLYIAAHGVEQFSYWGYDWPAFTAKDIVTTEDALIAEIKQEIQGALQVVDEIKAIYMERYRYELRISVLLNVRRYDDELWDKLLGIEYEIHNKDHGDFLLDFHHFPDMGNLENSLIHPDATVILKR